jgi:diacylglycerol kinase (ATP)
MRRRIAYLLNPISGARKQAALAPLISAKTAQRDIPFEVFPTDPSGRYDELRQRLLVDHFTDIVVAGGDGTISAVTSALRDTGLHLGIIPRGSGNGLALAAGIPLDPEKALDVIFIGTPKPADGFLINGRFSCMLSGIGFDAKVAHAFARQNKRGLWTYVKVSLTHFFRAKPYHFIIEANQRKTETDAYFISIANANQFGNQFTIAPKAQINDGLIDVVVVQKMNKAQVLLAIAHQLKYGDVKERIFREHSILYFQATSLSIQNPDKAPLHIDGDPANTAFTFQIEIIPAAFQLISP